MEDHGERLQYSVFLCDLTVTKLAELESAVMEVMNLQEDRVVQIDIGPLHAPAAVHTLGRPRRLPGYRPADRVKIRERSGTTPTRQERSHAGQHPFYHHFASGRTACRGGRQAPLARAAILPGHGPVFSRALIPALAAGPH